MKYIVRGNDPKTKEDAAWEINADSETDVMLVGCWMGIQFSADVLEFKKNMKPD